MEIQSKIGSKIQLKEGSETIELGRNLGVDSTDLTVSRRHIRFQLHKDQTKVSFEVIGKNPIWVRDNRSDEIRVYRRSERGEMESGDSFSVSSKNPVWFNLKRIECEDEHKNETEKQLRFDEEFAESSGIEDVEIETSSFSHIDPIKEFNFVAMGHEFDFYPKKMIRDVKNWDWFLEESGEESEDDEVDKSKRKKGARRKRKKSGGDDDDDDDVWTGESEEDTEVIKKMRNVQRPKYSTRSKDGEKNRKGAGTSKSTWQKDTTARNTRNREDEEEDEDEDDKDDDTLGGFIVDEDGEEGESGEDEEEEEEFEDDDNDDE